MSWAHLLVISAASVASMKAAIEGGDVDEAARQGQLAGPVVVEQALAARDRATRLAAITAAPGVEARVELLDALAAAAADPDRRTAIPAARAARTIARELARKAEQGSIGDDHAAADLDAWRDRWEQVALDRGRPIETRVLAVEIAARIDDAATILRVREVDAPAASVARIGVPLDSALADPDPAFRRAVIANAPVPLPAPMRGALALTVERDIDVHVALAAGQALCADLVVDPAAPILAALGEGGLRRLRVAITTDGVPKATLRDVGRCLIAAKAR